MSDYTNHPYNSAFEPYADAYAQDPYAYNKNSGFELFSFQAPALAPHPDIFESELDSSLAGFEGLELLTVDSNDAFASFLRSDTYSGPLSSFSGSSESAYDTRSSYSQSNYSESYYNPSSNYSLPADLEMQFQTIAVESSLSPPEDHSSFGELPPTPPPVRATSSDYQPTKRRHAPTGSDYRVYTPYQRSSASPAAAVVSSPSMSLSPPTIDMTLIEDDNSDKIKVDDEKRRYTCKRCPRGFARAYNLKTHMLTHDPDRPKPHACTVRNCGRSFSRKHDLGRHMTSIHREDKQEKSSTARIGVAASSRGWCDSCGRGFLGSVPDCLCEAAEIK